MYSQMNPVILNVISKVKNFSRSRTVKHAVKVMMSRTLYKMEMLLLQYRPLIGIDIWPM